MSTEHLLHWIPQYRPMYGMLQSPKEFSTRNGQDICFEQSAYPSQHKDFETFRLLVLGSKIRHGSSNNNGIHIQSERLGWASHVDVLFIKLLAFCRIQCPISMTKPIYKMLFTCDDGIWCNQFAPFTLFNVDLHSIGEGSWESTINQSLQLRSSLSLLQSRFGWPDLAYQEWQSGFSIGLITIGESQVMPSSASP